jgi:hypothetical protein
MTSLFKARERQEEFCRRGFTIVRLLDAGEVEEVRQQLEEAHSQASVPPSECGSDQSFCTPDAAYRQRAHAIVSAAIGDRLLSHLNGYRVVACGVINKRAGKRMVSVHRDPDVLSDPRLVAISAWCPLIDVDETSGALMILSGSHKLPNIEAAGLPPFYARYQDALKPLCLSVRLAAGEAILFNHRLFHGSWPNRRNCDRRALRATIIPAESCLILHRLDRTGGGSRFELVDVESEADGALALNPDDLAKPDFVGPVHGYAPNSNRFVSLSEFKACVADAEGRGVKAALRLVLSNIALLRGRARQRVRAA